MRFLKYEDVIKIYQALEDAGYADMELTITSKIDNPELFKRLNDDFFYRLTNGNEPQNCEEININMGKLTFNYKLDGNVQG